MKIPFFQTAVWITLNKFTIKNLTCNDVTTVCICHVLLILHLYFLSCHYSACTEVNCLAFFLQNLPKIMDKENEHCYHSYFCFLWILFVTNWVTKHLCLLNLNIKFLQQTVDRNWPYCLSGNFPDLICLKWAVFPALNGRYQNIVTGTVTL